MHPLTLSFESIYDHEKDGVDFINIFSRGKTELGRILSNFALTPFIFKNTSYNSVEGFWYSYITGNKYVATLYGYQAKSIGRKYLQLYEAPDRGLLMQVYKAKLAYNPSIIPLLIDNDLPFAHFYEFGGNFQNADKYLYTADLWRELTDKFKL